MEKSKHFIQFQSEAGRFEVCMEHKGKVESHVLSGGNGFPPATIKHAVFHARREGFSDVQFWREDNGPFLRIPFC